MRDFKEAWKSACQVAGVQGRILHDFQRTAVRNFNRAGVPDTVAMKITPDKTRSVFDRYNITRETDLRDWLGGLAGKKRERPKDRAECATP